MDSKKLSLLKEILVDKTVKDKSSHSCVEDHASQGKKKKKKTLKQIQVYL